MRAILYHKLRMLISEHLWLNAPVNSGISKGQCNEGMQRKLFSPLPNVFRGDCYVVIKK